MKSKQSPGPWKIIGGISLTRMNASIYSPGGHVAEVWSGHRPNWETLRANACLIEAAPKLLSGLKRALAMGMFPREFTDEMKSLIAKAEGK